MKKDDKVETTNLSSEDIIEKSQSRKVGPLINDLKNIWKKIGLTFPTQDMKFEEVIKNDEIEYPSEITAKYPDKESFKQFVKGRLIDVNPIAVGDDKKNYNEIKSHKVDEDEIERWYEKIYSFVNQIKFCLRNNEVEPEIPTISRSISHINFTDFKTLFNEPYDRYCDPSSIESKKSPVAYLVAIIKIALDIESRSSDDSIKFADRRPDLFELILNEENTYKEVKTIVLVNEILKSSISKHLDEHSSDKDIYSVLSKTLYPALLSVNFYHESIKYALIERKSSIRELKEAFDCNNYIMNGTLYSKTSLSTEQISVLTDYTPDNLMQYFNIEEISSLENFRTFLEKTQITSKELESILDTKLISIKFNNTDPRNLKLVNLNEPNLFSIHKVICLSSWFKIPIKDSFILMFHILNVLKIEKITNQVIYCVEYYIHLKDKYRISLEEYVSFIDEIPYYPKSSGESSFYDQIFNKERESLLIDNTIYDHNSLNEKDESIVLAIAKGLGLEIAQFQMLAEEVKKTKGSIPEITLHDISVLYRTSRLSKMFGLNISEFLTTLRLLGHELTTDLNECQKIYRIEVFCNWLKLINTLPSFIEYISSVPTNLIATKDILHFVIKVNKEIENLNEQTTKVPEGAKTGLKIKSEIDEIEQDKQKKISDTLLASLETSFGVEQGKIEYVFKLSITDLKTVISKTLELKNIQDIKEIPQNYLIFIHILENYFNIIKLFNLSIGCLKAFTEVTDKFEVEDTTLNLKSFYALSLYSLISNIKTKDSYQVEDGLLIVLNSALDDKELRTNVLSQMIEIEKKEIECLVAKIGEINTVQKIYTLYNLKLLSKKLDLPIKSLIALNDLRDDSNFDTVRSISQSTIVGHFDSFEKKKRDIFVDFYLNQVIPNDPMFSYLGPYIKTPNDLYEYFLIDNQVSTEVVTSRVAAAISSVQQFINGSIIGIEPGQSPPKKTAEDWNKNNSEFAIWASNVTLGLYPANYIDPFLRQGKSDFFQKLENTLSQAGLTEERIQAAVLLYLNDFEKIANLKVISGYAAGVEKNYKKDLDWTQGLVKEKTVYYYTKLANAARKEPGELYTPESGMFYSIAVSSQGWTLGTLYNNNSSDFVWINKNTLQFRDENDNQDYTLEEEKEILSYESTFLLSNANVHLVSVSKYQPLEYYVRTVDMSMSINGSPNPLSWSDQWKIEIPLDNAILGSIRPVLFNGRLYVVYGALSTTGKKEKVFIAGANVEQNSTLDTISLMMGYRMFDGTWSAPQNLGSINVDKDSFSLEKTIAFSIGEEQCIICLIGSNASILRSIDKIMTVSDIPDFDYIPALSHAYDNYKSNRIQNNFKTEDSEDSEIMDLTIESHKDGNIGLSQYIKYNISQFPDYKPIRTNTSFARTLITKASVSIFQLLTWETQNTREPKMVGAEITPVVDFKGANGKYLWELFFHLPFIIVMRLKNEGSYKNAIEWMKILFDPSAKDKTDGAPDYWNTRVLTEEGHNSYAILKPSDPDALAASNPIEYKKVLFYTLIDIVIAEADELYRILTPDSLNRAKQLYIQAFALLGDRPNIKLIKTWSPISLREAINLQNNALFEIQAAILASDITKIKNSSLREAVSFLLETIEFISPGKSVIAIFSSIFRVPLNTKLIEYWNTLESRLFNLRHSLDITGNTLSLGLFASPMNPQDLLRARNAGADSPAAMSRLNTKVPPYKFNYMLNQTRSILDTFCNFGDRLLNFLEKKDDRFEKETDISFAIELFDYSAALQQHTINNLQEEEVTLNNRKEIIEEEISLYENRADNMLPEEKNIIGIMGSSIGTSAAYSTLTSLAEGLDMAPNTFGLANGGSKWSSVVKASAAGLKGILAGKDVAISMLEKTIGIKLDQLEKRAEMLRARETLNEVDGAITRQEIEIMAAEYNLKKIRREQSQLRERYKFLSKKFTNKDLYEWLTGQMSGIYFQMYDIAFYMCLATEACYRFESGEYYMRFIQPVGFSNLYRGLNIGEKLKLNLEQMTMMRLKKYERFIEIEKEIKLSEIFETNWTVKLEHLRKTGEITFDFPEKIFAIDYPGHYYRQICTLDFSILGQQSAVHAILTQVSNAIIHREDTIAFDYLINAYTGHKPGEDVYLSDIRVGQQIALSSIVPNTNTRNHSYNSTSLDSGRYLPFEGTGLISKWNLAFTNKKLRTELLAQTTDIVFRVKYTSVVGTKEYTDHVFKRLEELKVLSYS